MATRGNNKGKNNGELTSKYDIAKLALSDKTLKGLSEANIDQLKAIGAMLRLQDDDFKECFSKLTLLHIEHDRKLDNLANKVSNLEDRFDLLNDQFIEFKGCIETIQTEIKDIKERRLNKIEDHISPGHSALRYGVIILISVLLAALMFLILFYNLPHPNPLTNFSILKTLATLTLL